MNPAKKLQFGAVVANLPFSYRWEPSEALGEDFCFNNNGLAPKSAADFAFRWHGFHFLSDSGVMTIILPHGVRFRGGEEPRISTATENEKFNLQAVNTALKEIGNKLSLPHIYRNLKNCFTNLACCNQGGMCVPGEKNTKST